MTARYIEFTGGDVEGFLATQENKDLLRFITCGSVDDGKSTLIGRLLYESKCCSRTNSRHWKPTRRSSAHKVAISISHCWSMVLQRARTGHHHRRGLSRLHHIEAQIHRRRYTGP